MGRMTVTYFGNNKRTHKIEENDKMTIEQVMMWERRVKAQSAILENLNETKDFDKIFARNRV